MVLDKCLPSWLGGNGAPVVVELGGAGGGQSTQQHWSPPPSPPSPYVPPGLWAPDTRHDSHGIQERAGE